MVVTFHFSVPVFQTPDGEAQAGEDQPQPGDFAAVDAGEHAQRGKTHNAFKIRQDVPLLVPQLRYLQRQQATPWEYKLCRH